MNCTTQRKSIGELWYEKNKINLDPPYQRETGVWDYDKKQLLIDSLLRKYDLPKLYFHDLTHSKEPISFAVVDDKQRLDAIWKFLSNEVAVTSDILLHEEDLGEILEGTYFKDFTPSQQDYFKSRSIDVVLIQNAEDDDIEDLFSRLNNGEPLNAAEKRNAMKGDMVKLIREVADLPFFSEALPFKNRRFSHYEVAAKLIRLELTEKQGGGLICDLKKKFLDEMVKTKHKLTEKEKKDLSARVKNNLKSLSKVFEDKDPLLGKQSYPQMYYIFVKYITKHYGHTKLYELVSKFVQDFQKSRIENLLIADEEKRDPQLIEFGRLAMQGTNDMSSMESRNNIMLRRFLFSHPGVELLDPRREFNDSERYAIWVRADKKCEKCGATLSSLEEMDADHRVKHTNGGKTTLENGRCLCITCNRKDNQKSEKTEKN